MSLSTNLSLHQLSNTVRLIVNGKQEFNVSCGTQTHFYWNSNMFDTFAHKIFPNDIQAYLIPLAEASSLQRDRNYLISSLKIYVDTHLWH